MSIAIAIEKINAEKYAKTGTLDLSRLGLSEIPQQIKELTGLKILNLKYNEITDISPIAKLTNLKNLYLSSNKIADRSPLNNLKDTDIYY
jgi:Leucine-rich repeat (LRR) protein